ncbi:MAG: penicillin-binding protein 2 [Candidatus Limnocylindrales bacterium]
MPGRTDRRLRLVVLLLLFGAMAGATVLRLSYWQLSQGGELRDRAVAQLERTTEDAAIRGDIVDRNGTVLATTSFRDLLAAAPKDIQTAGLVDQTVARLAPILKLNAQERVDLRALLDSADPYVVVERRLTLEQAEAIRAAMTAPAESRIFGVSLEPRQVRYYPNPGGAPDTTLASQLLGFVTEDGHGQHGLEQYYDDLLAGTPTRMASLFGASGALSSSARVLDAGRPGADLRLTIDAGLQLQLEKELYAAWVADQAARVSAVVLDPSTGDVLAWASVPGYDENDYATVASRRPDLFDDPISSQIYEPGSVMKMITASAALEAGVVTPTTQVKDGYYLSFSGAVVHNYDGRSKGRLSFQDAVAFSRNVAVARVAASLDRTVPRASAKLYDSWDRYGFGQRTGVDLAGEASGIVADPAEHRWEPIDLANRAFGQGVAVTQVQLAAAYAAMANGGQRVTPHLVGAVDGVPKVSVPPETIIDRPLASDLQGMLEHVTQRVRWYREGTQIPGYVVGGKTGTAQIWDSATGAWMTDRLNFSFVGFIGNEHPRAIVALRIQEAVPGITNGQLDLHVESYELFRRIALDIITEMDVPPAGGGVTPGPTTPEGDGTDLSPTPSHGNSAGPVDGGEERRHRRSHPDRPRE